MRIGYKGKLDIINKKLTKRDKERINAVIKKVFREYGGTLRLLGRG